MGQVLSLSFSEADRRPFMFGSVLIRRLIDYASTLTAIPVGTLTGRARNRDAVWTRWAIILVARERGRKYPQIAECLNRDHATIIHGHRSAKKLEDEDFAELVRLLREEAAR